MIYFNENLNNLKESDFNSLDMYDNYLAYIKESNEVYINALLENFNIIIQESDKESKSGIKKFIEKIKGLIRKFLTWISNTISKFTKFVTNIANGTLKKQKQFMAKDLSKMKYKWRDSLHDDKYFGAGTIVKENKKLFDKFEKMLSETSKDTIYALGNEAKENGICYQKLGKACGKQYVSSADFDKEFEDYNLSAPKIIDGLTESRKKEIIEILKGKDLEDLKSMDSEIRKEYSNFDKQLNSAKDMETDLEKSELIKILSNIFWQIYYADSRIIEMCIHIVKIKMSMANAIVKKGLEFNNGSDKEEKIGESSLYLDALEESVYEETLANLYEL